MNFHPVIEEKTPEMRVLDALMERGLRPSVIRVMVSRDPLKHEFEIALVDTAPAQNDALKIASDRLIQLSRVEEALAAEKVKVDHLTRNLAAAERKADDYEVLNQDRFRDIEARDEAITKLNTEKSLLRNSLDDALAQLQEVRQALHDANNRLQVAYGDLEKLETMSRGALTRPPPYPLPSDDGDTQIPADDEQPEPNTDSASLACLPQEPATAEVGQGDAEGHGPASPTPSPKRISLPADFPDLPGKHAAIASLLLVQPWTLDRLLAEGHFNKPSYAQSVISTIKSRLKKSKWKLVRDNDPVSERYSIVPTTVEDSVAGPTLPVPGDGTEGGAGDTAPPSTPAKIITHYNETTGLVMTRGGKGIELGPRVLAAVRALDGSHPLTKAELVAAVEELGGIRTSAFVLDNLLDSAKPKLRQIDLRIAEEGDFPNVKYRLVEISDQF